jgi:DNA replication and repair protein RecF
LPPSLKLPVVLFEPNHLRLLNGSPELRRNYLDDFNGQSIEGYATLLRKYNRVLAQRNSLLKSYNRPTKSSLFPWNIRISQLGGQLVNFRQSLIYKINELLPSIYCSLSGDKVVVKAVYKPQFDPKGYENIFLKTLEANIQEDLGSGYTSYGPHRDDFAVLFNDHTSTSYASRGELRSAVLALKIAELEDLKKTRESSPIILLDDVYSELDSSRRKALTSYLKDVQSFITTTDVDLALKNNSHANVIELG